MMNQELTKDEEKQSLMEGLSLTKVSEMIDTLIEQDNMKELKLIKDHFQKYGKQK